MKFGLSPQKKPLNISCVRVNGRDWKIGRKLQLNMYWYAVSKNCKNMQFTKGKSHLSLYFSNCNITRRVMFHTQLLYNSNNFFSKSIIRYLEPTYIKTDLMVDH